jgi:hypothetical protein
MQVAAQVAGSSATMQATGGGGGGLIGKAIGGARGLIGKILGRGAAAGGAAAAGGQMVLPGLGGAAVGGGGGAAAGGGAVTWAGGAATAGLGTAAAAAGVVAAAAGLEIAILKIADSTRKYQKSADDADKRTGRLQDQIAAKQTGLGDVTKAETMAYVAKSYFVNKQGDPYMFFNKFGKQVTPEAQEWLRGFSKQELANFGITLNINDKTYKGVEATDVKSYANTLQ